MITLSIIILIILILAFSSTGEKKVDNTYTASFGTEDEFLSSFNHGFAITGSQALTKDMSHTNVALFGPTGSGKSSSVIFSSAVSLARAKSSIVFFDVSGEVWDHTSQYLANKGYTLLRINFADPDNSESFNCLTHCKSISDIQKMAQLIIRNANGESKGDVFWEQSATMIISLFARYLLFYADQQYCNLQNDPDPKIHTPSLYN